MLGGCKTCWGGARMKLGGCAPPRTPPENPPVIHSKLPSFNDGVNKNPYTFNQSDGCQLCKKRCVLSGIMQKLFTKDR